MYAFSFIVLFRDQEFMSVTWFIKLCLFPVMCVTEESK